MSTAKPAGLLAVGIAAALVLATDVSVAAAKSSDWGHHSKAKVSAPSPTPTPTASPKPTVDLLAGGPTAKGHGVSIRLPHTWKQVPLTPEDFQRFIEEGAKDNPALKKGLQALSSASKKNFALFGANTRGVDFAENVSVILINALGVPSELHDLAQHALIKAGATTVEVHDVTLPQGPALRVDYVLPLHVAGDVLNIHGTQYYVNLTRQLAIVTFSYLHPNAPQELAMIKTLSDA